jgi:hypothetical protein
MPTASASTTGMTTIQLETTARENAGVSSATERKTIPATGTA